MASSFEKSVKGATKVKLAAPKAKYVEHILIATHAGEAGIAEVFRALSNRLRDGAWTIVFKSLIVVHYMIREGEKELTLRYLRRNPRIIALTHYSDAQTQGRNLRNYSHYLNERARCFGEVKADFVRSGEGRLRKLSVEKGLLREVECVQAQIRALLKCAFLDEEVDNEITLLAFRLLVSDLLVLFHVVNEGMINLLEHYFEMSRYDAERALEIYKVFTRQTADVVEYLQQARSVEPSTRLQIPNIKHAPTSLTSSLEEYLHDPDFDVNRRQYLAQQEAKKAGGTVPVFSKNKLPSQQPAKTTAAQNEPTPAPPPAETQPKIAPDLIDFFDSIETQQTPMFANVDQQQQQMYQQAGMNFGPQGQPIPVAPQQMQNQQIPNPQMPNQNQAFPMGYPQQNNPYPQQMPIAQPVQNNFTGHGFGGYTPQDQNAVTAPLMPAMPQFSQPPSAPQAAPQLNLPTMQQPPQDTNPFRASMMITGASASSFGSLATSPTEKSTNPFARSASISQTPSANTTPFAPQSPPRVGLAPTGGTNPFARNTSPVNSTSPPAGGLSVPGPSGAATNPFRASMLLQQQQAQQQAQMNGNFSGQTGTMGGWEAVDTVPVFPRANPTGAAPLNNQATGWQ